MEKINPLHQIIFQMAIFALVSYTSVVNKAQQRNTEGANFSPMNTYSYHLH